MLSISFTLSACVSDIDVEVPVSPSQLVVEGYIEPGQPPYVFLTRSSGYFEEVNSETFNKSFVHGAIVEVSNGSIKETLTEICSQDLPPSLLPLVAEYTGYSVSELQKFSICVYTSLNPSIFGVTGLTYQLNILSENKQYSAVTRINPPLRLDSLWFSVYGDRDSLGLMNARMSEPAGYGNCYRWLAKRLSKDGRFLAPFGSAFEDKFIDGQTFEFLASRGMEANSVAADDLNAEAGFFKKRDTVVIKFCTINFDCFNFIRSMETEAANNGNPFAAPTYIPSNIKGDALGFWCGYGPVFDTVICR